MKFTNSVRILTDPRFIAAFSLIVVLAAALVFYTSTVFTYLHVGILDLINFGYPLPISSMEPYMGAINILFYILGAAAIVMIGREYVYIERYLVFLVAAYLIFYPIAGINWSSFTTLTLFPALYLWAFYFYVLERRGISALLFLLSAATFQIYAIPVMMTAVALMSQDSKYAIPASENYLGITVSVIPMLLIINTAFHTGFMGYYEAIGFSGYGSLYHLFTTLTFAKPLFFIVLLIPLITFGFFGPRVLPIAIPYYFFGIAATAANGSPQALVGILNLVIPFAILGTIRWMKNLEIGIIPTETRLIRYALFSLILMNILVIITYFPFLGILSKLLGI